MGYIFKKQLHWRLKPHAKTEPKSQTWFQNFFFFSISQFYFKSCGKKILIEFYQSRQWHKIHDFDSTILQILAHYVRSLENFVDREGDALALCLLSLKGVRDKGCTRWNTGYNHSWYYTDVFRCTKVFTCLQNFKCEILYTTSFHAIRNENGLCYTS